APFPSRQDEPSAAGVRCPARRPCWRAMAEAPAARGPAGSPDRARLQEAMRDARDDAAPFALTATVILIALALVSRYAHWGLLGHSLWWIWLVVAGPYLCLSATLLFG